MDKRFLFNIIGQIWYFECSHLCYKNLFYFYKYNDDECGIQTFLLYNIWYLTKQFVIMRKSQLYKCEERNLLQTFKIKVSSVKYNRQFLVWVHLSHNLKNNAAK